MIYFLVVMDIHFIDSYVVDGKLKVRVMPKAGRNEIKEENGRLKVYLKAMAEDGKANVVLVKFFKKELGVAVEIKSGFTSREKVLRVL